MMPFGNMRLCLLGLTGDIDHRITSRVLIRLGTIEVFVVGIYVSLFTFIVASDRVVFMSVAF